MRVRLVAIGTKMPGWVVSGVDEYQKRLPREWRFECVELPLGPRSKSRDSAKAIELEGEAMLATIAPSEFVIALEVKGRVWSTEQLSQQFSQWQMSGHNLTFLIGGPDGLSEACRQRANVKWSLSSLTLPHPLVRVILVEQFYRAWTLLNNHPYHK